MNLLENILQTIGERSQYQVSLTSSVFQEVKTLLEDARAGAYMGIFLYPGLKPKSVFVEDKAVSFFFNGNLVKIVSVENDWDKQFEEAIKAGNKPENDLFNGVSNEFDRNDWTWERN